MNSGNVGTATDNDDDDDVCAPGLSACNGLPLCVDASVAVVVVEAKLVFGPTGGSIVFELDMGGSAVVGGSDLDGMSLTGSGALGSEAVFFDGIIAAVWFAFPSEEP